MQIQPTFPSGCQAPIASGGLEEREPGVLLKGHTTIRIALHSPVNTAESTGARQVKFLAQGKNNSRSVCWGIKTTKLSYCFQWETCGLVYHHYFLLNHACHIKRCMLSDTYSMDGQPMMSLWLLMCFDLGCVIYV